MSRLGWLVSHPEFRRNPIRVSSGVVSWEIHKLLSRNMSLDLDGLKLTARPIDGNGRLICYFGTKFDTIFDFLKAFLQKGMVYVDVGANIGSHAINAARLVGSAGSVFAFEADPDTFRLLSDNIDANGLRNLILKQICVSDHVGTLSFYKHKDSAKSSVVDRGEKLSVTLPSDTLDNLIADKKIDVLKVDVEGAELSVLRGARAIFNDHRRPSIVIIEVFDIRNNTDNSEGIREVLEGYGYRFYLFEGGKLTPFSGSALNAYAVHDSVIPQVLSKFSPNPAYAST
jgi:FkbM family methyltransferase